MTGKPVRQSLGPLPVTIVSGYLGAGKTTLVNSILAGDHGMRLAVLVNDFGKIAIDEALIGARDGDVIALANGCMCCQVGGGLYDAIDRILRMRERFDHLLIETSGVADPSKVAQIAVAEPDLELSRTVVLVDAVNFIDVLADPRIADTLLRQMRAADGIFLTKTDEPAAIDLACLEGVFVELGIGICGVVLRKDQPDPWRLLERHAADHARFADAGPLQPHMLPFESWSWEGVEKVTRTDLLAFAQDPSLHIYRLKGRLRCRDGKTIVIQKVGAAILLEDVEGISDPSALVVIGTKPQFDRSRVETVWNGLVRHMEDSQAGRYRA